MEVEVEVVVDDVGGNIDLAPASPNPTSERPEAQQHGYSADNLSQVYVQLASDNMIPVRSVAQSTPYCYIAYLFACSLVTLIFSEMQEVTVPPWSRWGTVWMVAPKAVPGAPAPLP